MPVAIIAVLLLALALVALSTPAKPSRWARALRIVVLAALAVGNGLFLLLFRQSAQAPQRPLDLFPMAAACFLIGGYLLQAYERAARAEAASDVDGKGERHKTSLLRALGEAVDALAVGAAAGTLTLLSDVLSRAIGLAGNSSAFYLISALSGLFAVVTLPRSTLFHLALAAAAWLTVAGGGGAAAPLEALPVMLALFMLSGWLGGARRSVSHDPG